MLESLTIAPGRHFTCSKLTIEPLEQDVKYAQNYANGADLVALLLNLSIFQTLF